MENHLYTTMASSSSPTPTTFIQADANTFRDLVQKLTGCTGDTDKLSSKPSFPFPGGDSTTPRRRRKQHPMRKLEIELGLTTTTSHGSNSSPGQCCFPGQVCPLDALSPVTPLLSHESMFYSSSGTVSPSSPVVSAPEEENATSEKGFYLHPSSLNTPRGSQLLHLAHPLRINENRVL